MRPTAGASTTEFGWPIASPDGQPGRVPGRRPTPTGLRSSSAMLWVRPLESLTARPLAGTEGATSIPFWSPDGRSLAFFAGGELRKMSLGRRAPCSGSAPAADPAGRRDDWNDDGTILFSASGEASGQDLLGSGDGRRAAKPLTPLDDSRGETASPPLPSSWAGGRRLPVPHRRRRRAAGLYVASARRARASGRRLVDGLHAPPASRPLRSSSCRTSALLAQPFDAQRAALSGERRRDRSVR